MVFVGTFTAGDLQVRVADGKVQILSEGTSRKFVERGRAPHLQRRACAPRSGQRVLYVTERCVFRLAPAGGLELIEIAPGIDLDRQILALMDFTPAISPALRLMERGLFEDGPMNLRERMLALPLAERIEYDERSNVLFVNFEGLGVDSARDIDEIETLVTWPRRAARQACRRRRQLRSLQHPARARRRLHRHGRSRERALLPPRHALRGQRLSQGAARAPGLR